MVAWRDGKCTVRTAVFSGGVEGLLVLLCVVVAWRDGSVQFVLLGVVVAWRDVKCTVHTAGCSGGMEGR